MSSRFYFISTDELLSILGSSEADCVQEHMIKVCHLHPFHISVLLLISTADVRQY